MDEWDIEISSRYCVSFSRGVPARLSRCVNERNEEVLKSFVILCRGLRWKRWDPKSSVQLRDHGKKHSLLQPKKLTLSDERPYASVQITKQANEDRCSLCSWSTKPKTSLICYKQEMLTHYATYGLQGLLSKSCREKWRWICKKSVFVSVTNKTVQMSWEIDVRSRIPGENVSENGC